MSKSLYQPRSGVLTVQYGPDAQTKVIENPPRFTWIPARLEKDCYVLEISERNDFPPRLLGTLRGLRAATTTTKPLSVWRERSPGATTGCTASWMPKRESG